MATHAPLESELRQRSLYFGYGSNLWIDQMNRRCPENKLIGIASLANWKWIISLRRYANVIPSPGDIVYGLIYELSEQDERNLDKFEGVAIGSYEKEIIPVDFIAQGAAQSTVINALVYVDRRQGESTPWEEYIYRMNMGIADGLDHGIPKSYIEKYLRPFIPAA
ncbi:hypothetical protein BDQ12DRAFT_676005 [Crucibulum laeve]|uniref:gamma-glutamylcyclotransferase n=1 Tax=Crucibulum laeve TaxID=68775 RepID=A0A5C3MA67_9AGAR|nr:hypothetical protein BDQ12DRAFT_676005 [Crucibulum laeve]